MIFRKKHIMRGSSRKCKTKLQNIYRIRQGQCYNLSCQLSVNIEYGYPIQHYFILIKDSVFFKSDNSI